MTSMPNVIADRTLAQIEAIADRLQRGEISPDEADAESQLVHAALEREMMADINATISARRASRGRRSAAAAIILVALILLAVYFWHAGAA